MQTVDPFNIADPPLQLGLPHITAGQASSGTLHVRAITDGGELTCLADRWNELAGGAPFRRFEWLEAWWRHYGRANWRLFVLAMEDAAGGLIGLAPWYLSPTRLHGRVAQFLGSGEVCSEYLTVMSRPGSESAVAAKLADWLATAGAGQWDLLQLDAIDPRDPVIGPLAAALGERGCWNDRRPGVNCWQCELPESWDAFLARLSKSRRDRARKLIRQNYDTGRATLHSATGAAEFERGYEIFTKLHQRRRQSLGQPGCFASPRFAAFHAEVGRRLHAAGMARLVWTDLAGRPVAAEYDFVGAGTVYYYQTGLEPDAIVENPGWLGQAGSLRRAIDEGYRTFDFLRGDETYKSSWGARPATTMNLRIVAPRSAPRARHALWRMEQKIRGWAKRGLARDR